MEELINNCLIACDAQLHYCFQTKCTNSHEWPLFTCASDLIDFFLKDKIDIIKQLPQNKINDLMASIEADYRFEHFLSARESE